MSRVCMAVLVALTSACFDPSFDHPTCGPGGECPGGLVCSADRVCIEPELTVAPMGFGVITSVPEGIRCGTMCSALFPMGTVVTLVETPDPGATFTGWSGSGCSGTGSCVVTLDAVMTVHANFGCTSGSQTFSYTGAPQVLSRPTCVNRIDIDASGAQGGTALNPSGVGGMGGRVQATLMIAPSDVMTVYVGGAGTNGGDSAGVGGYNGGAAGSIILADGMGGATQSGGGGGGASDVRINGTELTNRVLVAGGGGGGSECAGGGHVGGLGGGLTGGSSDPSCAGAMDVAITSAEGGSQTAGGIGADFPQLGDGSSGALGAGGAACVSSGGGGGGAGNYGGGGGCFNSGGGGSSFTATGAVNVIHTQGAHSGSGEVTISW